MSFWAVWLLIFKDYNEEEPELIQIGNLKRFLTAIMFRLHESFAHRLCPTLVICRPYFRSFFLARIKK